MVPDASIAFRRPDLGGVQSWRTTTNSAADWQRGPRALTQNLNLKLKSGVEDQPPRRAVPGRLYETSATAPVLWVSARSRRFD